MNAKELAERFHEAYERLAPQFGYTTRLGTRVFDPESDNGRLMIAVVEEVCGPALRLLAAAERNDGSTPETDFLSRSHDLGDLSESVWELARRLERERNGLAVDKLSDQAAYEKVRDERNGLAARVGELEAEWDALKRHAEAMVACLKAYPEEVSSIARALFILVALAEAEEAYRAEIKGE